MLSEIHCHLLEKRWRISWKMPFTAKDLKELHISISSRHTVPGEWSFGGPLNLFTLMTTIHSHPVRSKLMVTYYFCVFLVPLVTSTKLFQSQDTISQILSFLMWPSVVFWLWIYSMLLSALNQEQHFQRPKFYIRAVLFMHVKNWPFNIMSRIHGTCFD